MTDPLLAPKKRLLNLVRLQALLAVEQEGNIQGAAYLLDVSRQAVKKQLDELAEILGVNELFEYDPQSGKQKPTEFTRQHLLSDSRMIIDLLGGMSRAADNACTIAFLPQHAYLIASLLRRDKPVRRKSGDQVQIDAAILGEEHRVNPVYQDKVLGPLTTGGYDLVVGPPPLPDWGRTKALQSRRLYTSRLEAMVKITEAIDHIDVSELVERRKLLLPPVGTRSRETLRQALSRHYAEDVERGLVTPPSPDQAKGEPNIAYEAIGTKVLVAFGTNDHGVVVVPSDIAHAFKHGSYFGGAGSENFKWIPVTRGGEQLTQDVYVHVRQSRRNPNVDVVIDALREAVDREQLDVTKDYLEPKRVLNEKQRLIDLIQTAVDEARQAGAPTVAGLEEAQRILVNAREGSRI